MTNEQPKTRCIVLLPPESDCGQTISALLARRGWPGTSRDDPWLAYAELCLQERVQRSRAAWGLQRVEQTALVVAEPDHWTPGGRLEDLSAAVEKYLPGVITFSFDGGDLHPRSGPPALLDDGALPEPPAPVAEPSLHLADTPAEGRAAEEDVRPLPAARDAARVTHEEIEMLLHPGSTESPP